VVKYNGKTDIHSFFLRKIWFIYLT
jgi:hypothetical protein